MWRRHGGYTFEAVLDITNDAHRNRVMRIDLGRRMVNVDNLAVTFRVPQVGVIFDQIVADADNHVRLVEAAADVIG